MAPEKVFRVLAQTLIGMPISHVWRGYGSSLFVELGLLSPRTNKRGSPLQPRGEVSLGIEWSWRIEDRTSILCGSWSDEELWSATFDRLRGMRVSGCELFGALPEIMITTDGGIRLLSFSTTDGQPQWSLADLRSDPAVWFTVKRGALHAGDGSEPME